MSNITGIYKITSPSKRIYIGQAVNIERRFKEYKNIKKSKLQLKLNRSFNKYGIETHIFEIIEECDFESLNNRERYWQDFYNVLDGGLNCKLVNSSNRTGVLNEETKLKISIANTGKIHSKEVRSKMGLKNLGKKASEETRCKMSKYRTGRKLSKEWCENISKGHKGKKKSKEHSEKISKNKLNFYKDKSNHPRSKKVINTKTNQQFNSIIEAATLINVKVDTLRTWLNNPRLNKTNLIFLKND